MTDPANNPVNIVNLNSMVLGPDGMPYVNQHQQVTYPEVRISLRHLGGGGGWYWQHTTITFQGDQPAIHLRGAVRLDDSVSEVYKGDERLKP